MFDPMEFFQIARKLYADSGTLDSGMARTCINRAYYAAHLVVREKYKIRNDGAGSHAAVIDHLKRKSPVLGNKLANLFIHRKEADYILNIPGKPITKRNSGIAIKQAGEILKSLGKDASAN